MLLWRNVAIRNPNPPGLRLEVTARNMYKHRTNGHAVLQNPGRCEHQTNPSNSYTRPTDCSVACLHSTKYLGTLFAGMQIRMSWHRHTSPYPVFTEAPPSHFTHVQLQPSPSSINDNHTHTHGHAHAALVHPECMRNPALSSPFGQHEARNSGALQYCCVFQYASQIGIQHKHAIHVSHGDATFTRFGCVHKAVRLCSIRQDNSVPCSKHP
jgi:hypothetical protein|mmetsp:Transcript_86888/g.144639  ORF Transcript_86888/g.144639 Transcript_86888/m.144639 type:complete len:211 (+) Transcript_86888:60-692(+)